MEGRRMNQVLLFSSSRELANLVVTSNPIDCALTKVLELRDQIALPSSVQYRVYELLSPKCTIVAFVSSPDCTQDPLPEGGGDLDPAPLFKFLCPKENASVSINKTALTHFTSLHDRLSELKTQLLTEIEGQLIITGHSLGGSLASLFTLCLLDGMNKKCKCRPICITFGSPLIGDFDLQNSVWNSHFLHVVSNQDPVPGLFLPCGRSPPTSSHSQTTGYKPFGTYLLCSELGCACFDNPDLILELLKVVSLEVAGGLPDVDYGEILRNLKNRAICKGLPQDGVRFADPFTTGIIMELETTGFNQAKLQQHNIDIDTVISPMEAEARILTRKNKAFDAKKLNEIKTDMAQLEWYKKKSKDQNKGYYDCFKNQGSPKDMDVNKFMKNLTVYWEHMVAQVQKKPQKEGASFRTRWLYAGTVYRRMVEPLDIAAFYKEGRTDYINNGRSPHYKLLEQWYEEDEKPPSRGNSDSKKEKVSVILTEDSLFWAHVEEAILSCESLKSANSTLEQRSSWDDLVRFGEYVMEQIENYAVSPEIFLDYSSFMKWWGVYENYIDTFRNAFRSPLINFMKDRDYRRYG